MIKFILTNGYIAILPILIWNLIFASKLPKEFSKEYFDKNVPKFILYGESFFRFFVFLLPLFFILEINTKSGKIGLVLYLIGVILYFISWILLIVFPKSNWSKSALGFSAPAYTPIIWLIGISLMTKSIYFKIKYSNYYYIIPVILFSIFHITHCYFTYKNKEKI